MEIGFTAPSSLFFAFAALDFFVEADGGGASGNGTEDGETGATSGGESRQENNTY